MRGKALDVRRWALGGERLPNAQRPTPKAQNGQTLVATLIVIAIIGVLAVVLLKGSGAFGGKGGSSRADGKGTTVLGAAKLKAVDTACRSNLGQVRLAIQVYQSTNDEAVPATIQETRIGNDFYRCPLGKEPYDYDPATGKVSCPHPGHGKY